MMCSQTLEVAEEEFRRVLNRALVESYDLTPGEAEIKEKELWEALFRFSTIRSGKPFTSLMQPHNRFKVFERKNGETEDEAVKRELNDPRKFRLYYANIDLTVIAKQPKVFRVKSK